MPQHAFCQPGEGRLISRDLEYRGDRKKILTLSLTFFSSESRAKVQSVLSRHDAGADCAMGRQISSRMECF